MSSISSTTDFAFPLLSAIAASRERVVIAAPFIKAVAFERLARQVPANVELVVFTRWRPEEVRAGVSDLSVFQHCAERGYSRVLLVDSLHAKYYRAAPSVFVGSANVTGAALGWSTSPNIELLCRLDYSEKWAEFEQKLESLAIPATSGVRDAVAAAASALPPVLAFHSEEFSEANAPASSTSPAGWWLPTCRAPESLFDCYCGKIDAISEATRSACRIDLAALALPTDLSAAQFDLWMRSALMQKRFFATVETMIEDGPRFGELKRRLSRRLGDLGDARDRSETLQIVMRWLVHFFPDRFRIRVYRFSEHLERVC